jgi:D-alanyl-D-alanine carboxypeptidase
VAGLPAGRKASGRLHTNAKIHPVKDIVSVAIDIYYGKPFEIPAFEMIAVSPELLDKYVGVYSSPDAPKKWTITRDGGTLFVQPGSESAAALEATAQNKFQRFGGRVVFEFDAAKKR